MVTFLKKLFGIFMYLIYLLVVAIKKHPKEMAILALAGVFVCAICITTSHSSKNKTGSSTNYTYNDNTDGGGNSYGGDYIITPITPDTYRSTKTQCPICQGSGKVTCTTCNGTGKTYTTGFAPDYGYNTGSSMYEIEHRCTMCNGTGKMDCRYCYGDGWLN